MSYIDSVNVGGTSYKIQETVYITPSLSSSAYTANLSNFTLATGATVQAKFAATNPENATLNVNSTGAKEIHYNGAKITASQFKVNHVYTLVYDGTQWQVVGDIDTNTQASYGNISTTGTLSTASVAVVTDENKKITTANLSVSDPTATTTTSTTFIDTISQNAYGQIAATKKTLPTTATRWPTWEEVTGKPGTFAPSTHNHSQLVTVGDNRNTNTTPNDYNNNFIFQGLKTNTKIGSPYTDNYSYLVGLRGWSDSTGGSSHELAFNSNGIYRRQGATTSWGNWFHILDSNNTYAASSSDVSIGWNTSTTIATINGTAIKIKIPSNPNTNTTYTFTDGINGFTVTPSGGTAQTVTVTPSIANNITGSGTANYLTKFTGANTIGNSGLTTDDNNNLIIPGTIFFSSNTSTDTGKPLFAYNSSYTKFGIWYKEGNPDIMAFSASGNGDAKTSADFAVEGGGKLYNKGSIVPNTGNTTGSVGGTTTPVYVDGGVIKQGTALGNVAYINKPTSNTTTTFLCGDGLWKTALTSHQSLNGVVHIRNNERSYTTNIGTYVGGTGKNYARIKLPDSVATIWGMYQIEVSIRYSWEHSKGGKVLINLYHNATSPYNWTAFHAEAFGDFTDALHVYGSDGKYIYIQLASGATTYTNISINKILVGDAAGSKDISSISIDWVDELPATYQTAQVYRSVLEKGTSTSWNISISGNAATVNNLTVETAVPANAVFTDKYHKTGSWSGLTYTATAVNSADELKFTIPNKIQTNWELNAASGNSPALLFTRDNSLTDWKIFVTSGKLSFQSATDGSTWTERAYFKDNSGDFVATSFTGKGSDLTDLNASNLSSGTVPAARLPLATTSAAGAVKVGSGISVSDGTISVTAENLGLSNALHFIGITSTTLEDGSNTATLTAKSTNSLSKTTGFVDGDVVMDGDQLREYVWSGSAWRLLGITTSTAYTQPASTATNTWIAQISQGTDGKITATTGSLNTSGPWSGTATKASYPEGFSSRSTNATWGNQTGATVTCWNESDGGSIDIRKNNPSSGKVSIKVDGRFYGNEGNNPAMLMSDPNNTSYWGMGSPDGANNVWIRTTSLGIIPFQSGGSTAGHGGIGTSTWYFSSSYIQNMYGNHTGNVTTANITHIDGNSVDNGSWITGTTGKAPTATTTDGTTTYSGGTIGTSILTLGNSKIGANSASGVANNSRGYLRLYSDKSGYAELSAYETNASTHIYANTGLAIRENVVGIMFRPGSSSYYTHVAYETTGNEALVAATQNAVTSFIFVNGESYANVASDRWTKLTGASDAGNAPGLQIKQNCVSIGELIPSGTNASYKLNVNGISNFKGNITSTGSFYTSGRHISLISGGETDQFIDFAYAADPTASTAPGASWRIGALNSGSGDGNYFVIQTGGSATNATTWNNALRLGMNTYDAGFGGNVYPLTNNNKTLGTSSLKWANVYATTFTGNLTGNATSADSAKWFMNRGGSTVTISDGPWAHGQTGSGGTNAATVWHQRWKQSGLTYTPSGGSATTLTDSGDMVLWLAQSTTANTLTVNMAIDGIIYAMGGFKGNLNGQASTVARATFGNSNNGEHNANNIKSNGLWYYTSNGPATTLGANSTDGAIYSQAYNTSWAGQIAQDYRDGALFVRGLNNGTWKDWYAIPKFTTTTGGLGSATEPVYIDTNGELQACTTYADASVNYATSASSASKLGNADVGNSETLIYLNGGTATAGNKVFTLTGGTSVPANANMNNYKTIGNYYGPGDANARTVTNTPFGTAASTSHLSFTLKVEASLGSGTTYLRQHWRGYNSGVEAERTSTNGGSNWGGWRTKVFKNSNAATAEGSTNKPVYVTATGQVAAIDYTIETSVPSNALFTDTNTTYTIGTGDDNGQIKVTPSSGDAYNVSVKGLGSAAYTASTEYAPSSTVSCTTANVKSALGTDTSTTNKWLNQKGEWSTPTAAQIGAAPAVTGGYLPLSGGKMTGRIYREGVSTSWHKGRDNALVATSTLNGYSPFASIKTNSGSWDIGAYNNSSYTDDLIFSYVTDTQYSGSSATTTAQIKFLENGHIVAALDGNATTATSATSAGSATHANYLTGFSSRATTMTWGNQTGSVITCFATPKGGGWGFRDDNPAAGQVSMTIDGTIYIKEGGVNISDAVKSFSVSGQTVTYTNLWGGTGTFTTQDTKNTTGSTDSTSKLYLIGATSQAANPQTYSDSHVFETDGAFSAKTLGVNADTDNDKVTLQWNSTDSSLDFVFA